MFKVVFKNNSGWPFPGSTQCYIMPLVLAQPILSPRTSLYAGEALLAYTVTTPPVHGYDTQPLSHYTPITQL